MTDRNAGRRALVTGAARGIGRAIAERLEAEGATVARLDLDAAELELAGGTIRLVADVRDEAAVQSATSAAVQALGGLDTVIANAAIEPLAQDGPVAELDADVFRRVLDTNLVGMFLTCKHGLRALLAGGGGSMVLTASPTGVYGIAPEETAYSSSKSGAIGLMRVIAAGYADRGVRANCVLPGVTDTRVNAPFLADPRLHEQLVAPIPLGRVGAASEVAAVAAFLASDDASYVTGAVYSVDGGLTAI